jgi:hypothetical protein
MTAGRESMTDVAPGSSAATHRLLVAGAAAAGVLVAATLALWAHYGSAVFYEVILSGIAACF